MFELEPDEETTLIVDTVTRFANDMLSEAHREFEAAGALPDAVLNSYQALGLNALLLPEALGGANQPCSTRIAVLEALAAADAGAALALDGLGTALNTLSEFNDEAALAEHLLPLAERPGARVGVVWDPGSANASIQREGGCYQGTAPWTPCGSAEILLILDQQGLSLLSGGFQTQTVKGSGLRAAGAMAIHFDDTPITRRWDDPAAAARALARWQLDIAALMTGVFRTAAETSRCYAMERVAFGKAIAHHQALAFLIADMRTAVDSLRLLVQDAALRVGAGQDFIASAASAFVEAVETSLFVTPNALQIFGGQGFMQDLPLEKYMREARTLGLLAGGVDLARDIAGNALAQLPGRVELSALAPLEN